MTRDLTLTINEPKNGEFLREIFWNREDFKETVAEIAEQYSGIDFTEDQMPEARQTIATLRKVKTAVSDRRIEVKKQIMAPYTKFENEVKEAMEALDDTIGEIDRSIKKFEEKSKAEKLQKIREYFEGASDGLEETDHIFDLTFDKKWLNKSMTMSKVQGEIDGRIARMRAELDSLKEFCSEKYYEYCKNIYLQNLDLTGALNENKRLEECDRKQAERMEAERKAAEERAEQERIEAERIEEERQKTDEYYGYVFTNPDIADEMTERRKREESEAKKRAMEIPEAEEGVMEIPEAEEGVMEIPEMIIHWELDFFGSEEEGKMVLKFLNENGIEYEMIRGELHEGGLNE